MPARVLVVASLLLPGLARAESKVAGPESSRAKGEAIARQVEKANRGFKGERSASELTLINAHGDRTVRRMEARVMEIKSDGDKSQIEFQWPADVKGTRLLTWSHKSDADDQWLYLPAIKRVKRISSGTRSGSFMGSEFSYEDLGSQEPEKFRHRWLGDEVISGRKAWVLERIPVDDDSGYSKQTVWIDQAYMRTVKVNYYDRKGEKLKTALLDGFRKHGSWYRASRIEMKNHQTRKTSVLEWKSRELGVDFDEDDFDSDELAD